MSDAMHQELDSRSPETMGPAANEFAKFLTWAAIGNGEEMGILLMGNTIAMAARFIEQNYIWGGTREFTIPEPE